MRFTSRLRQAGLTLVELMVAMALGLAILLALLMLLSSTNRNNTELGVSSRMVESGRFSMQLLAGEIAHAGFWGGHLANYDDLTYTAQPLLTNDTTAAPADRKQVPATLPDPCLAYSVANWTQAHKYNLLGIGVQGSNVPVAGTAPFCGTVVTSPKPSSDVLVVRHAEPCVAGTGSNECASTLAAANPDVHFQVSRCEADTAQFALSTASADFNLRPRDNCVATVAPPYTEIRRFGSYIYFVKQVNGVPTLMRSVFRAVGTSAPNHDTADALVENVEAFRVEYGLDELSDSGEAVVPTATITWANPAVKTSPRNRGDGIPDGAFVRCTQATPCTAARMLNAVAVRIYVLVRGESLTPGHTDSKVYKMGSADTSCANAAAADTSNACAPTVGPFNDGYRRQLFIQTVRLVNLAGRRETP